MLRLRKRCEVSFGPSLCVHAYFPKIGRGGAHCSLGDTDTQLPARSTVRGKVVSMYVASRVPCNQSERSNAHRRLIWCGYKGALQSKRKIKCSSQIDLVWLQGCLAIKAEDQMLIAD